MKHVGEAVKEQEITFGSEDKVNVIGIATWGIVDRKNSLIARKVKYCFTSQSYVMKRGVGVGFDNAVKEDVEITAVVKLAVVNGNKLIMSGDG